jgi:hypothetical protein
MTIELYPTTDAAFVSTNLLVPLIKTRAHCRCTQPFRLATRRAGAWKSEPDKESVQPAVCSSVGGKQGASRRFWITMEPFEGEKPHEGDLSACNAARVGT